MLLPTSWSVISISHTVSATMLCFAPDLSRAYGDDDDDDDNW